MKKENKKENKKQQRKDYHHLGSPDFAYEAEYVKDNGEYMISFTANGSNTHFLGDHIQMGDTLFLGLSEQDFENLTEMMIQALGDRLKDKLKRFNEYQRTYYKEELCGTDEEFEKNEAWNKLK